MVGVKDSAASRAALRWAAGEAGLRGAGLRVVHAWDREGCLASYAPVSWRITPENAEKEGRATLDAVLTSAFGEQTPAWVTVELAEGSPERVLAERSQEASLLVVGEVTPPDCYGRSVGPVTRACLARAACPVVVVMDVDRLAAA